jgi:hypothetical protein
MWRNSNFVLYLPMKTWKNTLKSRILYQNCTVKNSFFNVSYAWYKSLGPGCPEERPLGVTLQSQGPLWGLQFIWTIKTRSKMTWTTTLDHYHKWNKDRRAVLRFCQYHTYILPALILFFKIIKKIGSQYYAFLPLFVHIYKKRNVPRYTSNVFVITCE